MVEMEQDHSTTADDPCPKFWVHEGFWGSN